MKKPTYWLNLATLIVVEQTSVSRKTDDLAGRIVFPGILETPVGHLGNYALEQFAQLPQGTTVSLKMKDRGAEVRVILPGEEGAFLCIKLNDSGTAYILTMHPAAVRNAFVLPIPHGLAFSVLPTA